MMEKSILKEINKLISDHEIQETREEDDCELISVPIDINLKFAGHKYDTSIKTDIKIKARICEYRKTYGEPSGKNCTHDCIIINPSLVGRGGTKYKHNACKTKAFRRRKEEN